MKMFIKLKDLKELSYGKKVYFAGYCKLQYLLNLESPRYYYSNIYGWRFDVYEFDNVIITTGYSAPSKIKALKLKEVDKFDNMAMELISKYNCNYEVLKKELNSLLNQFIEINSK